MNEKLSPNFVPNEKPERLASMRLAQAKSQGQNVPREVEILGARFVIDDGVHSPAFNADARFFASQIIPRIPAGSDFLEVGCGTAVVSVLAARNGAQVTATDISEASIENAKKNAGLNGVDFHILQGDVYDALPGGALYDIIYWNVPFGYMRTDAKNLSMFERAVFDPGHEGLRKYILGAKEHLKKGGKLLLGYSSTLGDMGAVNSYAKQAGLQFFPLATTMNTNNLKHTYQLELLIAHNP
ncbi:MAG: methyltransferase [bacterium]|nr:methyltransferase [bacterium]